MKNLTNILLIVAILATGGLYFKKVSVSNYSNTTVQGVSSAGAFNSSAKIASNSMAPATATASTTSTLNTDGTDRSITSTNIVCTTVGTSLTYLTGAGLATWTIQSSTSTSAVDAKANTNYAANITIATSSAFSYNASTTEGVIGNGVSRIWPSGTYLNDTFNATNTAAAQSVTVIYPYKLLT